MENMTKEISELLQCIRHVENEHNQLVDEYFQIKNHVKEALTNLNNDPSSSHLNAYNYYITISESLMKNIRLKRLSLTSLICNLHEHGIYLDDESESDNDINSSVDEGIDENSLSFIDHSSKLSSLDNSENNINNEGMIVD
ncbi:unnamed protein product [Rotaria socialis]|uniref:Uncharacterized protein n=1 Tax=Rotaria socialis TaxID=392032 RepID=A0A821WT99_9BILA|nr:unnamed protein product [Rotaria socialis]CAF3473130.1 unnamed protein product [Rotaria socialis]CAF4665650.1 unnamed protein product [Rotaria socialis]CAF4930543.1 unnamed protein product [Rotaria socialis]